MNHSCSNKLLDGASKSSSENLQGFPGDWGFKDIKKHQFQRVFEDWGSGYIGIEELG